MGKKTRKTRWRALPIENGERSDSEESSALSANHSTSRNGYHAKKYPPAARGRFQEPKSSATRSSSTNSENKITFNEDEYTRITTPRQDVLFKKGYLSKPKSYQTQTSTGGSTVSTGNSTGNGTPDHQSADGTEGTDLECEPQFVFPNGFIDQNGFYYGYDPYAPFLVYNAPYCYSADYPPARSKRYSTDSLTESTSPHNEETSQDQSQSGGETTTTTTAHPQDQQSPVYGVIYPTTYYYTNGISQTIEPESSETEPRKLKKRRRRKLSKPIPDGTSSDEYESEAENAAVGEIENRIIQGTHRPEPTQSPDGTQTVESSDSGNGESPAETLDEKPADNPEETKTDAPAGKEDDGGEGEAEGEGAAAKQQVTLKPDAKEFVPRSYRHAHQVEFVNFVPVPLMDGIPFGPAFLPPGISVIPVPPMMVPPGFAHPIEAPPVDEEDGVEEVEEGKVEEAVATKEAKEAVSGSKGNIDIARIVSKLEEAAKEQRFHDNRKQKFKPRFEKTPKGLQRFNRRRLSLNINEEDQKSTAAAPAHAQSPTPAHAHASTPIAHPQTSTPTAQTSTPTSQTATPIAHAQTPTPTARTSTPTARTSTPTARTSTPAHAQTLTPPPRQQKTSPSPPPLQKTPLPPPQPAAEAEKQVQSPRATRAPTTPAHKQKLAQKRAKPAKATDSPAKKAEPAKKPELKPNQWISVGRKKRSRTLLDDEEEKGKSEDEEQEFEKYDVRLLEDVVVDGDDKKDNNDEEAPQVPEEVKIVDVVVDEPARQEAADELDLLIESLKDMESKIKKKPQNTKPKRIIITDSELPTNLPAPKEPSAKTASKVVRRVQRVDSQEKADESPDKKRSSAKKKKKPTQTKAPAPPTPNEDSYHLLLNTSSILEEEKTNVEISEELDKIIQRGMYNTLEEKIKSLNIKAANDGFFKTISFTSPTSKQDPLRSNNDLTTVFKQSPPTPKTTGSFLDLANVQDDPGISRYPITDAVKNWMTKTRETTPEVELLKSPSTIMKELTTPEYSSDWSLTPQTSFEDEDLSWDDSSMAAGKAELAEDVLAVYEIEEKKRNGAFPKHASLPYSAICCSLM